MEKVRSIFVNIPNRDNRKDLAEYVEYFHPRRVGVTGSEEEITRVPQRYGAQYHEVALEGSAFGNAVNHVSTTYLIQPDDGLRFILPHATPASAILEAVLYLWAAKRPCLLSPYKQRSCKQSASHRE